MSDNKLEPPTKSSNSTNSTIYFDAESHDDDCGAEDCDGNCGGKMLDERMNGHGHNEIIDNIEGDMKTNDVYLQATEGASNTSIHDSDSSGIYEEHIDRTETAAETDKDEEPKTPIAASATTVSTLTNQTNMGDDFVLAHDPTWRGQKKHIFILSEAGKPIYSLHGNEDKLAILFGIIQALVSFVEHSQDVITSIRAKGIQFVFMIKSNLIFVAASRTNMSVTQLQMQLK